MPPVQPSAAAAAVTSLRARLSSSHRTRRGGRKLRIRSTTPAHEERHKGFAFNPKPPPPPPPPPPRMTGESQKWEDWELPCYITSFLAVTILGVGFSNKRDDVTNSD